MNRREFLRRALSLAPALVAVPAVTYFLPPRMGWPSGLLTMPNPDMLALICRRVAAAEAVMREQLHEMIYSTSSEDWVRTAEQLPRYMRFTTESPPSGIRELLVSGVPVVVDPHMRPGEWQLVNRGSM